MRFDTESAAAPRKWEAVHSPCGLENLTIGLKKIAFWETIPTIGFSKFICPKTFISSIVDQLAQPLKIGYMWRSERI